MTDVDTIEQHLRRVNDIIGRVQEFTPGQASDHKEFAKYVVKDLGVLADAVAEILRRVGSAASD